MNDELLARLFMVLERADVIMEKSIIWLDNLDVDGDYDAEREDLYFDLTRALDDLRDVLDDSKASEVV